MAHSRGRRTDYTWQGVVVGFSLSAAGSALQTVVDVNASSTLYRSRGEFVASIDAPTDGDKAIVALGLIRGTEEDVAIGVTAMPNSSDDLDADWLWHGFMPLQAQAANLEHIVAMRLTCDSKVMRWFRQSEKLILVVDVVSAAGTPAVDVTGGLRCLFGQ